MIAEGIGWAHSITILRDRIRVIRTEYAGIDPADRIVHLPGQATQCDLWFPAAAVPVGYGQVAGPAALEGIVKLPALMTTLAYTPATSAP